MLAEDVIDAVRHFELAVLPAQLLARGGGLLCAQGRTVSIMAVSLVGRAKADDSLHLDERGLVSAGLGLCNRLPDCIDVRVAVLDREDLPAVRLVALANVLSEGKLGVAVNGDAVVIVEGYELAEAQVASVSAGLVRDALLHAAVAENAVGVVVDQGHPRLVVHGRQVRLCCCQTHGIRDSHAEWARGHFDARSLKILWVARGLGAPLAELLDVINGNAVVTSEVKQGVLQHAAMAGGEHETVAVHPVGVLRVEVHFLREEHVADGCLAHRGPRVPAVCLVHGVHGEETNRVHAVCVDLSAHGCCTSRHARGTTSTTTGTSSRNSCH
mmetsp:Transcript_70975/g.161223  ORF Transcript_70975/g.161223 Transcript_70975/m.161223 type:complete len:327 (+) Transcript_70975:448-1428(+)